MLFALIAAHFVFLFMYSALRNRNIKVIKMVLKEGFALFHFTIYLRLLLEVYLFALISSANEVYYYQNAPYFTVSYIFSIGIIIFLLLFMLFTIFYFIKYGTRSMSWKLFQELYKETQDKKISKLFPFVFLLRRTLVVAILILMKSVPEIARVSAYIGLQILSVAYILYVRPLRTMRDNFIEGINEVVYFIS